VQEKLGEVRKSYESYETEYGRIGKGIRSSLEVE
jgi:hypothetical protein